MRRSFLLRSQRALAIASITAGVALVVVAVAYANGAQATLNGESFLAQSQLQNGSVITVTSTSCDPAGTSTISFTASGPTFSSLATNPYPGTFNETGTITIGPQTNGDGTGTVTGFNATFSIDSPNGQVSGAKALTAVVEPTNPNFNNRGVCIDDLTTGQHDHSAGLWTSYQASISSGKKTYADQGVTSLSLRDSTTSGLHDFREDFNSSLHSARPTH